MEKGGGSRLLQMQARFQQKQMQERELKIASLYEAQQARALDRVRHSPSNGVSANGNGTSPPQPQPTVNQPGKVRQMFEERRTKAGIDKSYPLQPIHNTERTRKALPNGYTKVTANTKTIDKKTSKTHITHTVRKVQKSESIVNGSGDLNHNHEPDLNTNKHPTSHNNGDLPPSLDAVDRAENNYLLEDETFPEALAPAPTPRSPAPGQKPAKPQARRSPVPRTSPAKTKPAPAATPPRRAASDNTVTDAKPSRGAMQKSMNSVPTSVRKPGVVSSPPPSGVSRGKSGGAGGRAAGAGSPRGEGACAVCGRRFAPDRLQKHQDICQRAHTKKRKPFDALKHRLAGTEAEPFISKLRKSTTSNQSSSKAKPLNSSWRQKHEEFISAIRAAKQVQAHINAGGKLSDLPPPPPSENPDYVQCPHCGRRFNQSAAERHIPKCKDYQFNKSKPAPKKR